MTVEELLKKGKTAIRSSDELTEAFFVFYAEHFKGAMASICCSFSDFDRLRNKIFKQNNDMTLERYTVELRPNQILYYVKNKKVYRSYARRLTDAFLDDFMKLHDKDVFKQEVKLIKPIKEVKVVDLKSDLNKIVDAILESDITALEAYASDEREEIKEAYLFRLEALEEIAKEEAERLAKEEVDKTSKVKVENNLPVTKDTEESKEPVPASDMLTFEQMEELTIKEASIYIQNATLEQLEVFKKASRKGVKVALEIKLEELKGNE